MHRNEARALLSLANLHQVQGFSEAALRDVGGATVFYHQAGFRLPEAQCLTVAARANRDSNKISEALAAFQQILSLAKTVDDRQQMALAEEGIASVLYLREDWPEALVHYERYYEIAQSIPDRDGTARGFAETANVLWHLGRYSEADQLFRDADKIAGSAYTLVGLDF
jgi:tetratricopeptide (TPR) repeat protein